MTDSLLTLSGVHTHIGPYHILQGVDLCVPRGGVTVLLGRNGAGKSTTLRTIMGLWSASDGEIRFDGTRIEARATPDIALAGIAYVPENMGIFSDLTVGENMRLAAVNGPMDAGRLAWIKDLFPPIGTFWDKPAGSVSPAIVQAMTDALAELKRTDTTILLVEQNFAMAAALGDTVAVMDDGRIVHAGTMAELAADATLQERLMGLSLEVHQ
jgi:branched-chain amino acid transport system ATP-binding protein